MIAVVREFPLPRFRRSDRGPVCGLSPADHKRFWSKVDRSAGPDGCWPWQAGLFDTGYGSFWVDGRSRGAHLVAYETANGPRAAGMHVCHRCDGTVPRGDISYRRCCNPAHLYEGTAAQNASDMTANGRHANQWTGRNACKKGHPLEGTNLVVWGQQHQQRICRTCERQRAVDKNRRRRERRAAKRAAR